MIPNHVQRGDNLHQNGKYGNCTKTVPEDFLSFYLPSLDVQFSRSRTVHIQLLPSLQDTIMALKALVEFAKMDTSRALYNMRFDLMPTAMNTTAQLSFDRTNWIDLQEFSVRKIILSTPVFTFGFNGQQISTCFY